MSKSTRALEELVLGSREVCQLTGISARQLQWWDERGLIRPARWGRKRAFAAEDVIAALVVSELRRKGLSLQKIARLMRRLHQEIARRKEDLLGGASCYLLTNGEALYVETGAEAVVERLGRQRKPVWLVSLSEQMARLRSYQRGAEQVPARGRRKRPGPEQFSLFE